MTPQPETTRTVLCSSDHRHIDGTPSVIVLAVDALRRVLLVPLEDEPTTWTLPLAGVMSMRRTSTVAAELLAGVLGISPANLRIQPATYEEACELHGLRLHVAVMVDVLERPARDDSARPHWWATQAEVEGTTLEPMLAELVDRDLRALAWT